MPPYHKIEFWYYVNSLEATGITEWVEPKSKKQTKKQGQIHRKWIYGIKSLSLPSVNFIISQIH